MIIVQVCVAFTVSFSFGLGSQPEQEPPYDRYVIQVSSILLAMQKEKDKINMTYSQIYGACIMNNTLCLGVFCALVYFRDLEWYFSAEVTVILLFELFFGFLAVFYRLFYPVSPTYLGIVAIALYPISLGMVAFMENVLEWG